MKRGAGQVFAALLLVVQRGFHLGEAALQQQSSSFSESLIFGFPTNYTILNDTDFYGYNAAHGYPIRAKLTRPSKFQKIDSCKFRALQSITDQNSTVICFVRGLSAC